MPQGREPQRSKLIALSFLLFHLLDDEQKLVGLAFLAYAMRMPFRIERGPYDASRSQDILSYILEESSDKIFKAHIRMNRTNFAHVLGLIQDDPVFVSTGKKPQRPPALQLAAFLMRCSGKIVIHTSTDVAIAEGTVYLYCRRVCTALLNIRDRFLSWPDQRRRLALKTAMEEYGFPGCIGILDATLIPLMDRPRKDGWSYFCRKKYYALSVQAICDHEGKFTSYDMGWPGSVQDTKVFRASSVYQERSKHFEWDEYILCDKGYPLTKFTIRPFAEYDLTNNAEEARARRRWNKDLSHLRIAIEHAFGRLKGRFPILRNFPGQDHGTIFRIIQSCMILHNILTDVGDNPEDIEDYYGEDGFVHTDEVMENIMENNDIGTLDVHGGNLDEMDENTLYQTGLYRRKALLDFSYEY